VKIACELRNIDLVTKSKVNTSPDIIQKMLNKLAPLNVTNSNLANSQQSDHSITS